MNNPGRRFQVCLRFFLWQISCQMCGCREGFKQVHRRYLIPNLD